MLTYRFENRGIKYRISPFLSKLKYDNSIPFPPLPFQIDTIKPENILKIKVIKRVRFEGKTILEDSLVNELKKQFFKREVFEYIYDENTKYQDYITVLSSHYIAVQALRKENQTFFIKNIAGFDKEYTTEQGKLKYKYPIRFIETIN